MSQLIAGGTFNPQKDNNQTGLRIRDLPESCTNELMYSIVFNQQKIDVKQIKAFQVRFNKETKNCVGDAFVYFGSEEYAQDAMSKIIGLTLHDKVLNCSLLMPQQDLKLKNNKNIYVKSLRSDVTLKSFFEAMRSKGEVLSVYLKQNKKTHKNDGYASFKSEEQVKKIMENKIQKDGQEISAIEINGVQYQINLITEKPKNTQVQYGAFSRNICLQFNQDLLNRSDVEYENLIRAKIQEKFNFYPTSVFVWGNKARHQDYSTEVQQEGQAVVEKQCMNNTSQNKDEKLANSVSNQTKCYDCYKYADSTCSILQAARRKAFVCFEQPEEATEFVNKVFSRSNGFDQLILDESETLTINSCIPYTKIKEDQTTLKNLINKQENSDKSYVYLGNIGQNVNQTKIQTELEKFTGTKVLSLKLVKQPTNKRRADNAQPEFQYATVHLSDQVKSNEFVSNFKEKKEYRDQFSALFGADYKYVNFLKPQKVRQEELKQKRIRDAAKAASNQNRNVFAQNIPFGFNNLPAFKLMQMQQAMANGSMQYPLGMPRGPMDGQMQAPFMIPHPQFLPPFFQQGQRQNNFNFQNQQRFGGQQQSQNNRQMYHNQNRSTSYGKNNNQHYQAGRTQSHDQQPKNGQNRGYNTEKVQNRNNNNKVVTTNPKKPQMAPTKQPAKTPIQPPTLVKAPLTMKDLEGKSEEERKTILGNPLFHKVQAILSEGQKQLAPKISGMLLDPEVFATEELLKLLEDPKDLEETVKEALEMIEEKTKE